MKTYLKAILPFYIFGGLRFLKTLILPITMMLGLRTMHSEWTMAVIPYIQGIEIFLNIAMVVFIVWAGFRLAKAYNGNIWISATTGLSFYLFTLLCALFLVLSYPLVYSALSLIFLGSLLTDSGPMNLHLDTWKSFVNLGAVRSIAMWTLYGIIGGGLYKIGELRKNRAVNQA